MDAEKLRKIEEIYHTALETLPHRRKKFLRETCGGDVELLHEVESLLSFKKSSDDFLETPPASIVAEMMYGRTENLGGKNVGHYKIISLLGKGGMGVVYLAEDTKLDRNVAIKFLSDGFVHDSDKLRRFIREAKAASALNHPNILTVYEIGEFDDSHYIAAEFIDGKVLNKHISKKKLPLDLVLDISIQIVSALQTAHRADIVHRDIKPDNVMIRTDGIVKVLDFGLAKLTEKQSGNLDSEAATVAKSITNQGMIMGTPNYMSPEQARGKGITHQTDIFSFGIVLYEMLSGALPFKGESALDTIGAILHKEPLPLIELLPQVPRDVEYIVNKTLQKNTDERYQNTKELLIDLRRVKQRLDYEEIERSFSPEDSNTNSDAQETKFFDSSDFDQIEIAPPNNLTKNTSPIIGREKEIAQITDLLDQDSVRLLTITGIGGTGKTRLADTISHLSLRNFSDGVFYIALDQIDNHELVVPSIAQMLGVREEDSKSLMECLIEYLRGKNTLLVLDNFEQVTKAATLIGELLAASQNLKILITSRVRLNLNFEREFTLQPLGVPTDEGLTANEFGAFSAIELFVQRAKTTKFDFALTEENAGSVAEICRRLDGLPLAIELAAARIKLFSPAAILKRLENSLNLLTGGAKDLPERQQTMRAAIAWSYDLLDKSEKNLLNRLSVFRGGFTLEGAEEVGKAKADLGIDLLDIVSSLVDKSLLLQREQADGEPRFRMLTVVREFTSEKLKESGEEDEINQRHAHFYNALSEKAYLELHGEKSSEWLEKIQLEHANFRAALEWTLLHEPQTALQIAGNLPQFWTRRGYLAEGNKWTRQALETGGDSKKPELRVKALNGIGILSWNQGNLVEAEHYFVEALQISSEIADESLITFSLLNFGNIKLLQGDFAAAQPVLEESFELANKINEKFAAARAANSLGEVFRGREDYETARSYYEKALSIARQESLTSVIQLACDNLSATACYLEDYRASSIYALESLKLNEEAGDDLGIGFALERFLALAVTNGKPEKAVCLFGALENIYESVGYKIEGLDEIFVNRYLDSARKTIGEEKFKASYTEGRQLNVKEAIALARQSETDFANEPQITGELKSDTRI